MLMNAPQFNQGRRQQHFGFGSLAGRMRRLALPLLLGGLAGTVGLSWVFAQDAGPPPRLPVLAGAPEAPAPTKTHLKTSTIQLPIEIQERARADIREIQIYVKDAAGAPWVLKERLPPTETHYIFQAPHDGEYWFKLGIVDRNGACNIADISREVPDTIVVVAAKAPALDLRSLGETDAGLKVQVTLGNAIADADNVRFHFQTANRQWHPLEALPSRPFEFCIPCQAVLTGMVRVSATDQAGKNVTQEFNLKQLPNGDTTPPPIAQAAYKPPPQAEPAPVTPPQPVLVDPQDRLNLATPPRDLPVMNALPASGTSGVKIISGAVSSGPKATPIPDQVEVITPKKAGNAVVTPAPAPGASPTVDLTTHRPAQPTSSQPIEIEPLPDKTVVKAQPTPTRRNHLSVNRHLVNHSRVSLEYQLDQVGASGVGRIDVYLTRDNGQSWQKVGEDTDKKSPVEITLPGDGNYGISLAVTNGRGFGGGAPQAGDSPDWWIEVDSIKPTAEITSIRPGSGGEDGAAFFISWTAKDKNLASEPIDLYASATREGPWRPIAKGLRNDGQYRWVPGLEAGAQAYLRLVVHDQAGNTAMSETVQPVPLDDMSRPRVRPLGIAPAPQPTPTVLGSGN